MAIKHFFSNNKNKSSIKKNNNKNVEKLNFDNEESAPTILNEGILKQGKIQNKKYEKQLLVNFIQNHPIITVLVIMFMLVFLVLVAILPLTLVKRKEERAVISR